MSEGSGCFPARWQPGPGRAHMEHAVLSAWFFSTAVLRFASGDPKGVLSPWGEHLRALCPRVWLSSPRGTDNRVGVCLTMITVAERGAKWLSRAKPRGQYQP